MKTLDKLFSFFTVQDPRQTRVNKVLFGMIVCWIGLGSIINTVNMIIYYWPEWTEVAKIDTIQKSLFFQLEWLKDIPDVPGSIFYLSITAIGILFSYIVKLHKEYRELVKGFLPILAEMKTMISERIR